jgi:hypothetical protein
MAEDRPLPCLGVLMLQTRFFPRLPGDVGHPATFTMAVRRRIVAGATPQRLVRDADPAALLARARPAGASAAGSGARALGVAPCAMMRR